MKDPKYQHGSSEEGWMEQNDKPATEESSLVQTNTPRTDAIEFRHCPPQPEAMLKKHEDSYALSRQLEQELKASQAEVERLDHLLADASETNHRLQAEVERLKHLLSDLLILTEKNYWNSHNYNQIKKAINPDNK